MFVLVCCTAKRSDKSVEVLENFECATFKPSSRSDNFESATLKPPRSEASKGVNRTVWEQIP